MYEKFSTIAKAVAISGNGTCGRNGNSYRLGAILVMGKCIVSAGVNSYKTHPLLSKYSMYPFMHAESAAIIKYGANKCEDTNLVVVRVRKDGTIGRAEPCQACRKLMLDIGVRRCYYSISNEEWGTIKFPY